MAGKKDGLDPRFDPRFQRGFDPAVPSSAPTAPAPSARPAPTAPAASKLAPSSAEGGPRPATTFAEPTAATASPGAHVDVESPPVRRVGAATVVAGEPVISGEPLTDDEPLRRFNPFRLALLVLSLASLAAAPWLMWVGYDSLLIQYGGGTDRWMQFVAQLVTLLPPNLLMAGLIGFVLWLGLGIVAPRRRREHE